MRSAGPSAPLQRTLRGGSSTAATRPRLAASKYRLVAQAERLRLAMRVSALGRRKGDELLGACEGFVESVLLTGPELLVIRVGNERGAADLLGHPVELVLPNHLVGLVGRVRTVRPHAKPHRIAQGLRSLHALLYVPVELLLLTPFQELLHALWEVGKPGRRHVAYPRIGDGRSDPVLEGDRTGHPVPGLTHPLDRNPLRIDLGKAEGEVYHRGYDLLPIRSEVQPLEEQRRALTWPVKGEGVVAALQGRRSAHQVHVSDGAVAAVVEDQ